jgi:hypothetical protein
VIGDETMQQRTTHRSRACDADTDGHGAGS